MKRWTAMTACLCLLLACMAHAHALEPTPSPKPTVELDAQVLALEEEGHGFIANKKSDVLHIDTCEWLPLEKNRIALESFAQGIEAGYKPCGECLYWVKEDGTSALTEEMLEAYIANVKSGKFHRSTCSSLPAEKNRAYFSTREEAVEEGYDPCGRCKP